MRSTCALKETIFLKDIDVNTWLWQAPSFSFCTFSNAISLSIACSLSAVSSVETLQHFSDSANFDSTSTRCVERSFFSFSWNASCSSNDFTLSVKINSFAWKSQWNVKMRIIYWFCYLKFLRKNCLPYLFEKDISFKPFY